MVEFFLCYYKIWFLIKFAKIHRFYQLYTNIFNQDPSYRKTQINNNKKKEKAATVKCLNVRNTLGSPIKKDSASYIRYIDVLKFKGNVKF